MFSGTYDTLGRRTGLAAEIDGTDDLINNYAYDYLNRMTQVTQGSQAGGNVVAEKRASFSYDAEDKGQFTSISRYADLAGTELVATSTYGYDAADRITSLTHADSSSSTLAGYTWGYDEGNRLTDFTVAGYSAEDATYTYDDTDQLTGADRSGTTSDESYTYDENGNRTGGSYSTGDNNQILSDGTYNYTYDDEGNLVQRTSIADSSYTVYEYDYRNRLVSVTDFNASEVKQQKVAYAYDIFNRLIGRELDSNGDGTVDQSGTFIYDGNQIILQLDDNGDVDHRLLWGANVDQLLADENASGDVYWALTDHLNTIRDWAEYDDLTDTIGVANHIAYDAFGNVQSESNASLDTANFGFTARYFDEATGLQYNTHRWYNAQLGRWMSQDPIGFEAGDENLYRYVGNGPTSKIDPNGLAPLDYRQLTKSRQNDVEMAKWAEEIAAEMEAANWKPNNPGDPGAYGKEFESRLFAKANGQTSKSGGKYYTDVVVKNGKVESIGTGAGSAKSTQLDIIVYDGELAPGDKFDKSKVHSVYDAKVGQVKQTGNAQLIRQKKVTGKKPAIIKPSKGYTAAKGWHKVDDIATKLKKLGITAGAVGGVITVMTTVATAEDQERMRNLIVEREKAGNDPTKIQVWIHLDLRPWLEDLTGNGAVARGVALTVQKQILDEISDPDPCPE
ncbi:hypothetical protein DTL42_17215 [Bremerella cremea]|uniref:Teneurin-like YD-shell domain-containing protein n=1 Tax=Bremerella cremea TaxID=1031537 RepID=A0A368KQE5_9BACT|nr:RHS repeat-associated core domain-containing protein [Bremerella cremea]RCS44662.1 hypothetical protein DTL42_17215 [Bremerella cremea]